MQRLYRVQEFIAQNLKNQVKRWMVWLETVFIYRNLLKPCFCIYCRIEVELKCRRHDMIIANEWRWYPECRRHDMIMPPRCGWWCFAIFNAIKISTLRVWKILNDEKLLWQRNELGHCPNNAWSKRNICFAVWFKLHLLLNDPINERIKLFICFSGKT